MPVILAALAFLFAITFVMAAATSAAHALWLIAVLVVLGFCALVQLLWHRRALHEIYSLRIDHNMGYERVSMFRAWPKFCQACGVEFHGWKQLRVHDDEETSPCMRLRLYLERKDAPATLPMEGFKAEILDDPAAGGQAAEEPAQVPLARLREQLSGAPHGTDRSG